MASLVRYAYSIGYLSCSLLLVAVSAVGQENAAGEGTLLVDRQTCLQLVEAVTPAYGAEYVPGRDVHGRPVTPAEGPEGPSWDQAAVGEVEVDIKIDLGRRTGLGDDGRLFIGEARIGSVTVKGREVLIDGRPLGDPELAAIRRACRELLGRR